jgi:hypothetical protein
MVKNSSRLSEDTLLIEDWNDEQIELLLKANLLPSYSVQVERHPSLNSFDGSLAPVLWMACRQSVSRVYRISGNREVNSFHSELHSCHSKSHPFPAVYVGYESASVRSYIPKPLRCFRNLKLPTHNSGVLLAKCLAHGA